MPREIIKGNSDTASTQNIGPVDSPRFQDETVRLLKVKKQSIEFYHVPTGHSVTFKAFVTSFEDGYDSNWTKEDVYGRNDPVGTFSKTGRIITLGWKTVAGSLEEARENLGDISLLINMLYPGYDSVRDNAATISSSPLFRVKFANLISTPSSNGGSRAKEGGLVASSSGLRVAPVMDEGVFDPGVGILYPQTVELSTTLTIYHDHSLGWNGRLAREGGKGFPYGVVTVEESEGSPSNGTGSDIPEVNEAQQIQMEGNWGSGHRESIVQFPI